MKRDIDNRCKKCGKPYIKVSTTNFEKGEVEYKIYYKCNCSK